MLRGYSAARRKQGWLKSKAFGRSFLLETKPDRLGHSQFNLRIECVESSLARGGSQLAEYEGLLRTEPYQEANTMAVTSFEKGMEKGQRTLLQRQLDVVSAD